MQIFLLCIVLCLASVLSTTILTGCTSGQACVLSTAGEISVTCSDTVEYSVYSLTINDGDIDLCRWWITDLEIGYNRWGLY